MESLSRKERIWVAVLSFNLLVQFVLSSFSSGDFYEKKVLFGYNPNPDYSWNINTYDFTDLLLYGIFPIGVFAIYYFVIRKDD